ncbi:MAG: addiction module antidote protein [Janthinobacterium lividum]
MDAERPIQARENGFTWLAAQTGLGRDSLYRALSAEGNPSFRTIRKVLHALGADESILAHTAATAEPARKPIKRNKSVRAATAN